jgi:hypothetical protein
MNNPFKVGDRVRVIDNGSRKDAFKLGATATVIDLDFDRVKVQFDDLSDSDYKGWLYPRRFKLINDVRTIDKDLELARTFLNKEVYSIAGKHRLIVSKIKVYLKEDPTYKQSSDSVCEEVEKNGFCVALEERDYHIPVSDAMKVPVSKVVNLNDTYDAVVTKTDVTVGCQKFSLDKIREVIEASETI